MKKQVSSLYKYLNTKLHKYNCDGEIVSHLLAFIIFHGKIACVFLYLNGTVHG